jgi:hypothetical protein
VGLLVPLLMMALIGTLAYEFQVVPPLLARVTLHGGAETYGFMTAAMAVGAVAAGLYVATRARGCGAQSRSILRELCAA